MSESLQDRKRKLSNPEDRLWYGCSEVLTGRGDGAIWRSYFVPGASGKTWSFKGGAASLNHKGAAGALAYLAGEPSGRSYWLDRLEKELRGGVFKGPEGLGKYEAGNVGAVLLVWSHARATKDEELEADAHAYIRATVALLAMGAAPLAARSIPWGGHDFASRDVDLPYIAATGARQDVGHLDGDMRAWIYDRLVRPERKVRIRSLDNARRRQRGEEWKSEPDAELRELLHRKVVSETWVWEALERAQRAGLALSGDDRAACMNWIGGSDIRTDDVDRLEWMFREPRAGRIGSLLEFHWLRWPSGFRATYLASSGERCIFADTYDPGTRVAQVAFPFDLDAKAQRTGGAPGTCELADGAIICRIPKLGREVRLQVPPEPPSWHVVLGPDGWRVT